MKRAARLLGSAGLVLLGLVAVAAGAQAFATPGGSGDITLDTMGAPPSAVWQVSVTPPVYQVNESIIVSAGDTLQIPAGVRIEFVNSTELIVLGGLEVRGTAASRVEMAVVPDAMSMAVAWGGVRAAGASSFILENAVFTDTIDIAYANASGARLTNVTYQGRLFFDNSTGVVASGLLMTITPTDVGRIALWIEGSSSVDVTNADLQGGTGWGGAAVIVESSNNVRISEVVVRDDNANLMGIQVIASRAVTISNYTFTQGPMGGDPNQALDFRDATDVVVDRVTMAHLGLSGLGAIYGVRSNVTISNSTFDPALSEGVWQYPGTITGLNATHLPVRPEAGATLRDIELVRADVRWAAGGAVSNGTARITNGSWSRLGTVAAGFSPWMWALRVVNESGAVNQSLAYRLDVTCNCTSAPAFFNLTDDWGVTVVVFVGDSAAPVVLATVLPGTTAAPLVLDAAGSFDNAGIVAYLWTALGGAAVGGLPCAQARCEVDAQAPGNITFQLNVTDSSAHTSTARVTVFVVDATPPLLTFSGPSDHVAGQGEPETLSVEATDNDPAFLPRVEWYLDGVRIPGDTLTVTVRIDAIGDHAVLVLVSDDGGNAANHTFLVEIRDSVAPQVGDWSAPAALVAPAAVELNGGVATDNVGVVAWRWHIVGPGTEYNLTGPTPNATLPSAGRYNITLTADDAEGNHGSRTFMVDVAAPPVATGGDVPVLLLVGLAAAAAVGAAAFILRKPKEPEGSEEGEGGSKTKSRDDHDDSDEDGEDGD